MWLNGILDRIVQAFFEKKYGNFRLYRFLYASVHSGLFEVSQKAQSSESAYQSALSRIVQSIEPNFRSNSPVEG